jgi:hypothetical protein
MFLVKVTKLAGRGYTGVCPLVVVPVAVICLALMTL